MVNDEPIENVIAGPIKKAIVEYIRLNPDCPRNHITTKVYGPDRFVRPQTVAVHICQINRALREHKYKIQLWGRTGYFPTYRLVKLEGTR